MGKIILYLFFIVGLTGCVAFGTRTTYLSPEVSNIYKIGYIDLDNASMLLKVYPRTTILFREAILSTLNEYGIDSTEFLRDGFTRLLNYSDPDTNLIKILCIQNKVDAILMTKLHFIYVDNYLMMIPIGQSQDTEVKMKLFDKTGNLIVSTSHKTKSGNSYVMPPTAEITVHDGTVGALKRVLKELGFKYPKK